jgi:hypothetical protein
MRLPYETPKVTVVGSVQDLTQSQITGIRIDLKMTGLSPMS